jgi:hypothetical protein
MPIITKGKTNMTKKFATALCLTLALGLSTSMSAMPRDGGKGFDPIQRVIKIIKKILNPITNTDPLQPHP